jgi:hypothetical protein
MSWNYRILSEGDGDHRVYFVAEVYYDKEGNPKNWSERDFNPLKGWDDQDELRGTIEQIYIALSKPTLRVMGDHLTEARPKTPAPTPPSFDPAWDKGPEEIARIQALPNRSRLT